MEDSESLYCERVVFKGENVNLELLPCGLRWKIHSVPSSSFFSSEKSNQPVEICHFLSFEDVLGVEKHTSYDRCFVVYNFEQPVSKKNYEQELNRPVHLKGEIRNRVVYPFVVATQEGAQVWIDRIRKKLNKIPDGEEYKRKRLAILVNPASGSGSAMEIWSSLRSMFEIADVQVNFIATTHAAHALEMAETIDENSVDGIVCISGDGLLYEILNGLMSRSDWRSVVSKISLGIIPGGSSNGLAASIGCSDARIAAFYIIKGHSNLIDIFTCLHSEKETSYGFLSLSYSIIADIDYESEKYRAIGGARQTLVAVMKLFQKVKAYKSKISYITEDATNESGWMSPGGLSQQIPQEKLPVERKEHEVLASDSDETKGPYLQFINREGFRSKWNERISKTEGDLTFLLLSNVPLIGKGNHFSPKAELSDGCLDLIWGMSQSKTDVIRCLMAGDDGTIEQIPGIIFRKVKAFVLEPLTTEGNIMIDGERALVRKVCIEIHPALVHLYSPFKQQHFSCSYIPLESSKKVASYPPPDALLTGSPGQNHKLGRVLSAIKRNANRRKQEITIL
eukprot:TRINITY_DN13842_c0_g1_i1.p1 TRINITY_DN13842_c0_g1~~TRINITY_DN13842_c0_g1_i1.p1  ORF type:complete len:565 (+),score=130.46 TRINITY_DN13842_c0_g1_i1:102-1796(+)